MVCFEATNGVRTQLQSASYFVGDPKSNNVGEYEGILLMRALTNFPEGDQNVRLESHSQLVVDQLNRGKYHHLRRPNTEMMPFVLETKGLVGESPRKECSSYSSSCI